MTSPDVGIRVREALARAAGVPVDDVAVIVTDAPLRLDIGLVMNGAGDLDIDRFAGIMRNAREHGLELWVARIDRAELDALEATYRLGGPWAVRRLLGPRLWELPL